MLNHFLAAALHLQSATYLCNLSGDAERGITVPRMKIEMTTTGDACLSFFQYSGHQTTIGKSCGQYNPRYGTRLDDQGEASVRFDGFLDFTAQSHVSLPPVKSRRWAIVQTKADLPVVTLYSDSRHSFDIQYVCQREKD